MVRIVALILLGVTHTLLAAPTPEMTGEIRSYHQVGDKIKGEFARLHPDGSVTKTLAFGDAKQGLQYKTYQMDPHGNVKTIDSPNQFQQPQQINQAQDQPQSQLHGQAAPQSTAQAASPQQTAVPAGVNWFLKQPMVAPVAPALDPVAAADPFAPADPFLNPMAAEPLVTDPFWTFWSF